MASLTTIALLERRRAISRDLFTRYWRDVHGVMAARIPGFESYTQNHVTLELGDERAPPIEGIAIVEFANEQDRACLAASPISAEIVRDEANLFERALLFNLAAKDVSTYERQGTSEATRCKFALLEDKAAAHDFASRQEGVAKVYDLAGGDPSLWNGVADVSAWRFLIKFESLVSDVPIAPRHGGAIYRTDDSFVLVSDGRPTALGLRGADALRTIEEAAALNQRERHVERLIYGV